MSAQALLSVIAPPIAPAPQGSSGEAVSGFQSLLAALTADAAPDGEAATVATPPVEGAADGAPVATGFLAAPPLLAGPLVVPAPSADVDVAAGSAGIAEQPAKDAAPQGTTPLPVDKVTPPKGSDPPVQPVEPGSRTLERTTTDDTQLTLAETAAVTEAAQARSRIAGAVAAPSPPPQPQPQVQLRPLAERTSKPIDATTARSGEAPAADGSKPSAAATATGTAAPPAAGQDRPIIPETFAAVLAADVSAASDTEDRAADLPLTAETASSQSATPATARDVSLSTLSRATIDATAQIAAQILRKLEGRSTRFEIALTPDELGRVDVKLDIDSEGRLNARLAFDNPLAATDMKGRVDDLRRQLEDAGFHLADDAFEFTDRDSGSSAFDRGQNARDGQSRAFAAASRLNAEIDVAQPPRWLSLSLSPSGVDMKV